jgi:hypothetical protein
MLEGAVDLAEGHYGAGHPSCLSPLLDLLDALGQVRVCSRPVEHHTENCCEKLNLVCWAFEVTMADRTEQCTGGGFYR